MPEATYPTDPTLPPIPPDLVISRSAPPPVNDAALATEHPVSVKTADLKAVANPLVVLGDSLSHGFKSLAIHDTDLSWPALVASAIGVGDRFRRPHYDGPKDCPGLPLNLEALLRRLEEHAGVSAPLLGWHTPEIAALTLHLLHEVKSYWEQGEGSALDPLAAYPNNLAIYGWDVRDSLSRTAADCRAAVNQKTPWPWLHPHLPSLKVANDGDRAALRVLNGPGGEQVAMIDAAKELGEEGVGVLVVALGANNALGAVLKMKLVWTPDEYEQWDGRERLAGKKDATVWRPSHFRSDYTELCDRVREVNAAHVILTTVPHVTIAPLLHGFGSKPNGSRYFARYGRVWVDEDEFDPNRDECLSGEACRQIDSAIDAYNAHIVQEVVRARAEGLDWHVFDLCNLLDSLAYRRYLEDPSARPDWFQPYELPEPLRRLSPWPDTRFFGSDGYGRSQGGLIALDGVHPTTIGYAIMAREVLAVLHTIGVGPGDAAIDFDAVVGLDTLIMQPPRTLSADLGLLGHLYSNYDSVRELIRR
jgi:hypothetical protein